MTMIERVARAMFNATPFKDAGAWDDQSDTYRRMCRLLARAAIEAMREPTAGMVKAAREAIPAGRGLASAYARDAIIAAIRAALSEPDEGGTG